MPKDERADALLALKKLLENNPDADPYGIKEAWLEIVWKDELLSADSDAFRPGIPT
jgi:hypothetical protein